jgi:D-psicose/D-tagatose/L-ribulose 3-epimerase
MMTRNIEGAPARQIGVNTWVWASPCDDKTVAELAPQVAQWGFDVLELPLEQLGDWDPAQTATVLGDLGLGATVCVAMSPGRELVSADAATVGATQDYLRGTLDAAAVIGAPVIAGPAYSSVGRTWRMSDAERAASYAQYRENMAPVVEHASQVGVRIGVEPLNRYETSLLNTVDQTLEALDGLPPEHIGLALDTYHLNIEERDPAAATRRATGRIMHVQVCANDRGAPGADHVDWPAFLSALDAAGYAGPLVIESFTAENESIATAAAIWRPLARTQDALATDGLAFLRGLTDA